MNVDLGLMVLRASIGLIVAAHGAQKAFGWWGGVGPAGWTKSTGRMGWQPARPWAALSIAAELAGGLLLATGLLTPLGAALVLAQTLVIILRVHLRHGLWNSNGGIEYPLTLWLGTAAILVAGPGSISLDHVLGLSFGPLGLVAAMIVALAGAGVAALWPVGWPRRHLPTSDPA